MIWRHMFICLHYKNKKFALNQYSRAFYELSLFFVYLSKHIKVWLWVSHCSSCWISWIGWRCCVGWSGWIGWWGCVGWRGCVAWIGNRSRLYSWVGNWSWGCICWGWILNSWWSPCWCWWLPFWSPSIVCWWCPCWGSWWCPLWSWRKRITACLWWIRLVSGWAYLTLTILIINIRRWWAGWLWNSLWRWWCFLILLLHTTVVVCKIWIACLYGHACCKE